MRDVRPARALQDLHVGAQLALAAVDHDQVGQASSAAPRRSPPRPPSRRWSRRRSTSAWLAKSSWPATSRIRNRRYSPVRGFPSSKTTMLPTVWLPWNVADVVALDPHRRDRQAERVGQLLERARGSCPSSASQRACSRASVSAAFRPASSTSCRFSPRRGTSSRTRRPRRVGQERLEVGRVGRQRRARGSPAGRTWPGRSTGRTKPARTSSSPASRVGLQEEHVPADQCCRCGRRRAGRRPGRLARARPSTSCSVRAKAAIFWFSIVRSMERTLSRRIAARS